MPDTADTLRAKRKAISPSALKRKYEAGQTTGEERALVKVGITATKVLTGEDDLSTWDDEELTKGRRRDPSGGWAGKPPTVVPKALHDELVRRTLTKAHEKLRENLCDAIDLLGQVIRDPSADNKDRLVAAKMVMDRVMGKDPIQMEVAVKAKWEQALEASIVNVGDIIDADSWEADDEDDDG